jgi:putative ABC transport system permease protein
MLDDLRFAIRTFVRNPGFAVLALVTLALGIAANTAIFSVVNGVLLRPLPYPDADRLVAVWTSTPGDAKSNHSAGDFLDLERDSSSFAALAGYRPDLFALAYGEGQPYQRVGAHVTPAFFDVFGMPAELGRAFSDAADANAGGRRVVLGHDAWAELTRRDEAAVGRTIEVNGEPHLLLGVMPAAFGWPAEAGVWVLSARRVPPSPIDNAPDDREVRYFEAVARLRPGLSAESAGQDLSRVAAAIDQRRAATAQSRTFGLGRLKDEIVGDVRAAILILQVGVAIVLLIACANISSLLIARTTMRERELAVRSALGARAGRLVRQLLTESLLLGAAGGVVGILAGGWLITLLVGLLPSNVPRADGIALDATVAVVTLVVAVAASVLFGALPALQASRSGAASVLRAAGSRGSTGGRSTSRSVLVTLEVAMTLVLLVSAGLLANSLARLERVDPGFTPEGVTLGSLVIPQARYPTSEAQTAFYRRLLERLREAPGLDAAAVGFPGPFRGTNASGAFYIDGRPEAPGAERPYAYLGSVSERYFDAMGIEIVAGRAFRESDTALGPPVAIVSAVAAARYWPGEDPIGRRLRFDDDPTEPWITIVGVTSDVRQLGLREPAPALVYMPFAQFALPFTNITVSSRLPDADVADAIRAVLRDVDPELPVSDITTLGAVVRRSTADSRFRTFVFGTLAAMALALAAVGLYGLVSYTVAQRTREIGVRVALGAMPGQVIRLIVGRGLRLVGAGLALGLAGSIAAARALSSFLFGVSATDPVTIASVALLLLGVAALASYLPARRALGVDPVAALRAD